MSRGWWVSTRWVTATHLSWLWTTHPSGCRLGAGELVQLLRFHPGGAGTSAACSMQWAGFFPSTPLGLWEGDEPAAGA